MTGEHKRQFAMCYAVFLLNGMLALSIGSLLPFVRDARGLDYAFCGMIVSLHSVGNLISSFAAGALPVFLGRKKTILLFELFFPLAYLLILFSDSRFLLAAAFFATGLARGANSNFCNTRINAIATGKAWALNALHACFAVGAFVFPLLLLGITAGSDGRWVIACGMMIVAGCIVWTIYLLMPELRGDGQRETFGEGQNGASGEEAGDVSGERQGRASGEGAVDASGKAEKEAASFGFLREPLFYLCITTLFFYLCAEQGVIGWMITYFKDTGLIAQELSQVTASLLWVMILCGRLLVAFLSTRIPKERLLPLMGVGIVVFFIVLLFSSHTVPIMIGIMGFGFSMAGIYATTVALAGELIRKYTLAWSFILTGASFGSILMPSVIGTVAAHAGIAVGMSTIALALVIDMVCILLLVRYVKRS